MDSTSSRVPSMKFSARQVAGFGSLVNAGLVTYSSYCGLAGYEDIRLTATTLVALAGTLIGFLLTALSLLIGVADRKFIENLRMTGHYGALVRQMLRTAAVWLCVAALGLMAHTLSRSLQGLVVPVAMGFAAFALLQFVVVGFRFSLVVKQLSR